MTACAAARGGVLMAYEFTALRPGETERTCAKCGCKFQPSTRTQKYCAECGKNPVRVQPRMTEKEARRRMERKVDNNILGLNDALFRELERIEACGEDRERIEIEGVRADKVCDLASNIIANGRLMLAAAQMSVGVAEAVNVPKILLGNGDGK